MPRQVFNVARTILALSLVFLCVQTAKFQEPSPTPTDEERRLQEEIRILKLKKEKATLNNEIREAVLSPSATALEGKAELTDVTLEPQIMSYRAMTTSCNCIATRIHDRFGDAEVIVIYDPDAAAGLKYYRFSYPIVEARLKGITDRLQAQIPSTSTHTHAFTLTPPIVTDVLRSFADVLALFRTDTKLEGETISIAQKALVAEMMFALNEKYGRNIVLYDPGSFSPDEGAALDASGNFRSKVLRSLVEGYQKRDFVVLRIDVIGKTIDDAKKAIKVAEDAIAEFNGEITKLEAAAKKTKTKKEKENILADIKAKKGMIDKENKTIDEKKADIAAAESKQSLLTKLVKDFDTLVAELVAVNEKTGTSELLTFLKAESLELMLKDDQGKDHDYYWLDLSSVSAGGNNRTRKNLFRYLAGSKIDHSGGVIIQWQFLNPKWQFVEGGKTQVYEGYLTSRKIRDNQITMSADDLMTKCGYPAPPVNQEKILARGN